MMRGLALLPVLLCAAASAQNWALINPAYKYNYANDGSDTISNQIFVTHIDTLGVGSFRYELNHVASSCGPCIDYTGECWAEMGVYSGQPQFLGIGARLAGSSWELFKEDTLTVLSAAQMGTSWTGSGGIAGAVVSVSTMTILGVSDSVKVIGFSNGDTLTISREHGIVGLEHEAMGHSLIGIQGDMEAGAHFPEVIDLFDYQPGDVLQYHGTYNSGDGVCVWYRDYTHRYDVIARQDEPGRTEYTLLKTFSEHHWGTELFGGEFCYNEYYEGETTLTLGVDHHEWTPDNFFASPTMDDLWPGALGPPPMEGEWASDFHPSWIAWMWRAYMDDSSRYCFEPEQIAVDPWEPRAVTRCADDSSYWPVAETNHGRYVEGIGMMERWYYGGFASGEEVLEGASIGEVNYGFFLDVADHGKKGSVMVYPVPASNLIVISHSVPGRSFAILDLFGRTLLTSRFEAGSKQVDIDQLPSGSYLLAVEGLAPERFIVAH